MQLKRKTKLIIFGLIIIIIGIIVGIIPLFLKEINLEKENTKVKEYINNTSNKINVSPKNDILLVLEIPKINLKRVVYNLDSELNTIKKNIEIMKESSLPNIDNGNVILEGHNGDSSISYFNKLDKLSEFDLAYIYYQGTKYIYCILVNDVKHNFYK